MSIYFVRTAIFTLNRSFKNVIDAKKYIKKLKQSSKSSKLDIKLLHNGVVL